MSQESPALRTGVLVRLRADASTIEHVVRFEQCTRVNLRGFERMLEMRLVVLASGVADTNSRPRDA